MIRSLEIENFRGFRKARLDNLRRFAIVTGENGAGKTALLEALFVAGGGSPEIYLRTNAWRGRSEFPVGDKSTIYSFFEDFFYQFDSTTGMVIRFRDSLSGDREVRVVAETPATITLPFDRKAAEVAHSADELRFIWKTPEGQFDRRVELTDSGIRIQAPQNTYKMVFVNNATLAGAAQNSERFSSLSERNEEQPVVAAVQKLFPKVTGLTVLASGTTSMIHATVSGIGRKVPVPLVSAGINKFLALLLAITATPRGALLIDEIENGLCYKHFAAMWKVVSEYAEQCNTQIFATTHSKEFLEAIAPIVDTHQEDYCLIRAEKTNGECSLLEFSGREFGSAVAAGVEVR